MTIGERGDFRFPKVTMNHMGSIRNSKRRMGYTILRAHTCYWRSDVRHANTGCRCTCHHEAPTDTFHIRTELQSSSTIATSWLCAR